MCFRHCLVLLGHPESPSYGRSGRKGKASRYIFIYSITQMVFGILEAVIIVGEIDIDITAAAVSLLIPDQPLICVGSCLGCILFELTTE